ncbi:Fic family protein [Adhaeretor mobilis]|uniref:Adenosine monophosphate-protein transferase SoFic n=1 Tax=Adhaeretor mobilis TaxID=1930276 RepID=A0A517N386_9BACT|nr:Fic family protein [Adhaeretor mobilis]QDT01605.1 Adenosine monophosphate-protein transferase SoFic [Adhaeretor mobilis]
MKPEDFTAEKPGELRRFVSSNTGEEGWLFLPAALPPDWEFPASLWPLLADAKETLGTLNGIGQTLPSPDLLLRPLQSREAISSSAIEGTYVDPRQLLLYDIQPEEPTSEEGPRADQKEVSNYRRALQIGCELTDKGPILNRHLLAMHKLLMQGVRGAKKSPGEFRRIQVQIGSQGKYVPPPPGDVPEMMAKLERYLNEPDEGFDPLVRSYLVHYQFEAIHPFVDGNGRIGRVLLALMTKQLLGHQNPWLYMSAFFEQHREEYVELLHRISTRGEWYPWIEFCLHGSIAQARDSIIKCEKIRQLRDEYHERVRDTATPRSHAIIDDLFQSPVMTTSQVAEYCNVTFPTAQNDLRRLCEVKILVEDDDSHPRNYYAPELLQIAYEDA